MTDVEQRTAAKAFSKYWAGKGDEKGESQKFWLSLLEKVFGVNDPEQFISFEDRVFLGHTSFIDGYIPETKVLIEQKKLGKDLNESIKQSDGTFLSPIQQAKRYAAELPYSKRPRWIVTCNFSTFNVYDMEHPGEEPEIIELENLEKEYYRLSFLVDSGNDHLKKEMELSLAAGDLVGVLYDALLKQYKDQTNAESLKSLNILCVRIVFCLYAEDAGIFGSKTMFHDYLSQYSAKDCRKALIELFRVLDQKESERDQYLEDDLAAFPYVNGGLFANEDIEIPIITDEIKDIILSKASEDFDWSEISPTIFGAVFESTLNPETRRSGGMHYTSIENIHKVIDPLFLDELRAEYDEISVIKIEKTKKARLESFQKKLSDIRWLDPACGSGNFLTETYISIRKIENQVIRDILDCDRKQVDGQMVMGVTLKDPIKVKISQFYGIEINDFAVTVAKTALWIAESQMLKETENILMMRLEFLPLKTAAHIVEGNALHIDWETVIPKQELNYIMGNPPFKGAREQSKEQKEDLLKLFDKVENAWDLDYVACWYKKAFDYIDHKIRGAFISTDSITSGVQPAIMQKVMLGKHCVIDFAYRPFKWVSESKNTAQVYCVIIGFSKEANKVKKFIFDKNDTEEALNINWTLRSESFVVTERKHPLCKVPEMVNGNMERGGVNLILEEEEMIDICHQEPNIKKYIRPFYGTNELMGNKKRYCIWLVGADYRDIVNSKILSERVARVKEHRLSSKANTTRGYASSPTLFAQRPQPEDVDFIIVPRVTSKTDYLPMAFMKAGNIVSDKAHLIPCASLYHFGILVSHLHELWASEIGMKMGTGYSYSKELVYNTFPWPNATTDQIQRIKETAQNIINVREELSKSLSLKQMYGNLMPHDLIVAHKKNDSAVLKAYGFSNSDISEADCVNVLMRMYQELVAEKGKESK